jgi:formate hydrogenlyase subunit 3/multisubunit Na+/H+ antiporter MnhD subunit
MVAAAFGSVACVVIGLAVMVGPVVAVRFGRVLSYSLIDLRFDPLSGVFLVALGAVGAASSVYGLGYHEAGRSRFDTFALIVFVTSLVLVFGSASAFSFLFAWELMALGSAAGAARPRIDRPSGRASSTSHDPPRHGGDCGRLRCLVGGGGSLDFSAWHTAGRR